MNHDVNMDKDACKSDQKSVFRTHLPQQTSTARHLVFALIAFMVALAIAIYYAG